ncbi:MAG: HAD family phosphatase [Planctomycetes bacterium]|nr:HAD family phosphatase [Planctomycetota bacterium]
MSARAYDAILLDVDGTLVDDAGHIHPRTLGALRAARARGVVVMVATGRSESGVAPVIEELGIDDPVLVYNGSGLWDPRTDKLLEERVLSNRTVARTLEHCERAGYVPVVMKHGLKAAPPPTTEALEKALSRLTALEWRPFAELPREYLIRITLFSDRHSDSAAFEREVAAAIDLPTYLTHFPLAHLVDHRTSALQVVDVHAPCRGKGEAVRVLRELHGIEAARVVAVGDATNDVPMFEAAGLAVAMAGSMPQARAAAARVIGDCNGDAIGALVEELFLG